MDMCREGLPVGHLRMPRRESIPENNHSDKATPNDYIQTEGRHEVGRVPGSNEHMTGLVEG